ncbi:hypothetical protein [Thiohalorhabdus sp.]|uniref:hypothetical protein n=1 Tax=Thiohalorhabdus sp. TaxID=3094134 RepID=UPI002FC37149
MSQWSNARYNRFEEEAEAAGYEVETYQGRNFYHGPAVQVDSQEEYQELIRATSMNLQTDQMGLDLIVYPR